MDEKAKELLEQKKANEHGGQLKSFVENQVEGTGGAPLNIEANKSQQPDQQHHMKDQENRKENHTGSPGTDPKV